MPLGQCCIACTYLVPQIFPSHSWESYNTVVSHLPVYYLSIFPQIDFLPLNKTSMVREWFLETVTQIVQGFPEMTLNFPPKNCVGILSFPTRWTVMISCTVRTCRSRLELAVLQLVACRFTSIFATDANFVGIVPVICRNKDSYYWSN